jgi:hypothetical protein
MMKIRSVGYTGPGKTNLFLTDGDMTVGFSIEHEEAEKLVLNLLRNLSFMDPEWKGLHIDAAHLFEAKRREAKRAVHRKVP